MPWRAFVKLFTANFDPFGKIPYISKTNNVIQYIIYLKKQAFEIKILNFQHIFEKLFQVGKMLINSPCKQHQKHLLQACCHDEIL